MDMDELFSQVDEKRKVSIEINLLFLSIEPVIVYNCMNSFSHFPSPLIPIIGGLEFIPACIGQTSWIGHPPPLQGWQTDRHTLITFTHTDGSLLMAHTYFTPSSLIVDIATREIDSTILSDLHVVMMAHFRLVVFNMWTLYLNCFCVVFSAYLQCLWLHMWTMYLIDGQLCPISSTSCFYGNHHNLSARACSDIDAIDSCWLNWGCCHVIVSLKWHLTDCQQGVFLLCVLEGVKAGGRGSV